MSDHTTQLILGDAAASELNRPPRRRWFRRNKKRPPPLTHCENCGSALTGPYCAKCGQPAIDYRRSFGTLLADAADAFFNIDARFFQSFGWLLIKPWRLTNEFVEGKRARHVHPLRVYLIASVAFFLVINYLSKNAHMHGHARRDGNTPVIAIGPALLAPKVASPTASPAASASATPGFSFNIGPSAFAPPSANPKASPNDGKAFEEVGDEKDLPPFARWIVQRSKAKLGPSGDRGDLFVKTLISNLAPMVLCCIPLFAFVLKLLYIFKRRFYIEHLVFALHTHAFVFLSTIVIIGLGFLLNWKAPPAFAPLVCVFLSFAVLVQLLIAIRRVYRQNWFATIFKFLLGSLIYLVVLMMAFAVTAVVTLALP